MELRSSQVVAMRILLGGGRSKAILQDLLMAAAQQRPILQDFPYV